MSAELETKVKKTKKRKTVQYDRWGYFFIAPFFIIYIIFSLIPLLTTFINTFFENYEVGLNVEGPNFIVPKYFGGQKKFYDGMIKDTVKGLQQLKTTTDQNGVTTILIDDINDILIENAPTLQSVVTTSEEGRERLVKAFPFDVEFEALQVQDKDDAKKFIDDVIALIQKREWSLVKNFRIVFESDILKYTKNTLIMWIIGFIPQIIISLILAACFTNTELRLRGQQFFKTVIYMPNLIMASAFAMLFFTLFSTDGPINSILLKTNLITENIRWLTYTSWTRILVATMNFLMWFGNTTIMLMAGIMGIDESLFEAARIDGASPLQVFFKITLPLLIPILVYVLITSMIGGIQMFDVPQILTNSSGNPNRTIMTLIMYLNNHLRSKNYGVAGAVSVLTFAVTAILSAFVYQSTMSQYSNKK